MESILLGLEWLTLHYAQRLLEDLAFLFFCGFLILTGFHYFLVLLQKSENIKIFLLEENLLLFEIMVDNFLLFFDGLAAAINFLKDDLHKVGLTLGQKLHFFNRLFIDFS